MRSKSAIFLVLALAVGAGGTAEAYDVETSAPPAPGAAVTVQLASGRCFHAAIDGRTDAEYLWLRWSLRSGYILRPVRWDRVVSADVGDRVLSGEELSTKVAAWSGGVAGANTPSIPASGVKR